MHKCSFYFTLLNKMNTIVIVSIVIVIIVIIGAIILNSSNNDTTVQQPSGNGSTTVQQPSGSSDSSTTVQQPSNSGTSNNNTIVIPPEEVITYCPADADWPQTNIGETVELSCPSGMIGKRVRLCREDGSWYDMSDCTEQSNEIITPDSTPDNIDVPVTQYCSAVVVNNPDLTQGKVSISFNVAYRFYFKNCAAEKTSATKSEIIDRTITGSYRFTFIADVNKIPDEYKRVKTSIPATVFNSIQDRVNEANNTDCKLSATDFAYDYPSELKVFKNEEYLIIISNTIYDIETYSYDYPYNYINNSIATIQSKHQQNIIPLNNVLYKIWTHVRDWASEATCNNTGLSYVLGHTITPVYTNKYITFCLILIAMLRDANITLSSLGDCKVTFRFPHSKNAVFMLSEEPYCQGIYTVSDMKNSIVNLCKVINSWSGKGWTYTIDLNAAYQSTPTVYNIASKKTIPVFNTGSNLVSDERYNRIVNSQNPNIPSLHCNILG